MIPETFHFLRPMWLLAILPVAAVAWAATRSATRSSAWRRVVDAHLLRHLLLTDSGPARRWPCGSTCSRAWRQGWLPNRFRRYRWR